MPHYPKLVGQKCYLSPCSAEDAEQWAAWDNDLEVALPLGDEAYTLMPLEKEADILAEVIRQQQQVFSIVVRETDALIGRGMLFSLDWANRSAMLGLMIGEKEYWNQGFGQEASRLLLDYAFNLLNLNSVMLGVFDFNPRAIQAYHRVGFREIGRRRQARIIGSRAYDVILMDILAEEFQSPYVLPLLQGGE